MTQNWKFLQLGEEGTQKIEQKNLETNVKRKQDSLTILKKTWNTAI